MRDDEGIDEHIPLPTATRSQKRDKEDELIDTHIPLPTITRKQKSEGNTTSTNSSCGQQQNSNSTSMRIQKPSGMDESPGERRTQKKKEKGSNEGQTFITSKKREDNAEGSITSLSCMKPKRIKCGYCSKAKAKGETYICDPPMILSCLAYARLRLEDQFCASCHAYVAKIYAKRKQ